MNNIIFNKDILNHIENKNNSNILNEMIIKYKINDNGKVKLFGDDFVNNNKDNCKLIINGKEKDLLE